MRQPARPQYGRLSVFFLPRSDDCHLCRTHDHAAFLDSRILYLVHPQQTVSQQHDYREIACVADRKLQLQRLALTGAGYRDGWEHVFDLVPVTTRGCEFPPPTRYKGNDVEDYHYSDEGLAVGDDADGDGRMKEARSSTQPRLSVVLPGGSEQPLIQESETDGSVGDFDRRDEVGQVSSDE